MNQFESIFICKPHLPAEKVASLTEKVKTIVTQSEGTVNLVNEWGKRRLAYPIASQQEGIYVLVDFAGTGETVKKVETFYAMTEEVIRYLTVKKVFPSKKRAPRKPRGVQGAQSAQSAQNPQPAQTPQSAQGARKEEPVNAAENKAPRTE